MNPTINAPMENAQEEMGMAEQERLSILVVDDEEEIRSVLRLMLTRAGYDVREAEDGESALVAVQGKLPDLILLDVLMPGMDGFEVCRRVRAEAATSRIPILMLSAKTDARSREEGLRAGATAYLTKPFVPAELIRHVEAALDRTAR